MKKLIVPMITIFVFILIVVVVVFSLSNIKKMTTLHEGNMEQVVIPIVLGQFQDSDCGMVIDSLLYASEIVAPNGKTWFFHDHGGMVRWIEDKPFKKKAKIWVYAKDIEGWIDGREAWYSQTDITPMEYGFGAYQKKQKNFINFETMTVKMLRGENMSNPQIRQKLLEKKD